MTAVLTIIIGAVRAAAAAEPTANLHVEVPRLIKAPEIDGAIQAEEWAGATRLSAFTQLEPAEGRPATERTDVLIGRDDQNLYIAFEAHDSEAAKIRATRTPRDKIPETDDIVLLYIDPFHTGTRCYTFGFNALGVQRDGVWSQQDDSTWDTVLVSNGAIYADRFVVEVAIPLTSLLGGARGQAAWDVNFGRFVARKGEQSWWAPRHRQNAGQMLADFGTFSDMGDVTAISRFELIPTALGKLSADNGAASSMDETVGITALVPVSRIGRVEATFRPDFSEVESDEAQITFNERYALFYPEKRPFFLEGQDQFGTPASGMIGDPLTLVHTRALAHTREGVRFLSAPGQTFVGGLATIESTVDGEPDGTSMIVRALRRWPGSSQAGLIATRRSRPDTSNTVLAGDARIALPASSTLTLQLAASRSSDASHVTTEAVAGYADFSRQDSRSLEQVVLRVVPRDFESQIGFIPRNDLRQAVSHGGVYFRPARGWLLYALPMFQHVISLDDRGRLVDNEYLPHVELQFTRQTQLWFGYRLHDEAFRGVRYTAQRFEPRLKTAPTRWLAFSVRGRFGSRLRYDNSEAQDHSFVGPFREVEATVNVNAGRNLTASVHGISQSYGASAAMPEARVWLARTQIAYQFNNFTYLRTIVQWDTESRDRQFSLLAARVLNYGTQLHAGVEYRAADAMPAAAPLPRHWATFVRVSYLLRR